MGEMIAGSVQLAINIRVSKEEEAYLELLCELLRVMKDEPVYSILDELVETTNSIPELTIATIA